MDIARLLKPFSKADIFARPASAVVRGSLRMEAGFYGSQGYRALESMETSGFEIGRVSNIAEVRWFGPFPRTYVDDPSAGVPFLSSSEIMAAKLEPKNYLSKVLTPNLERLLISQGTILVSCSGTIGNVAICTKDYDDYAVSQHAIRVDSKRDIDRGVLYVFLLSELGQFLVTRNKSGSVIESIYADDVESLPLPTLPKKLRQRIFENIKRTCDLRVKANALLNDVDGRVQRDCNLPLINSMLTSRSVVSTGSGMAFNVSAGVRLRPNRGLGQLRIDATFHEPHSTAVRAHILQSKSGTKVSGVVGGIFRSSLRARNYVDDSDAGVPMIGGKQLMQIRPAEIKYLSKVLTRQLATERIVAGTTLVTCGGTVGRTLFAHRNYEQWVASEHIMRLIPDAERIAPGYLYAFLASPYGQIQVEALMHGSVIPQIRDFEFGSIAISLPRDRGAAIHDLVVQAFDSRADAKVLEDEGIDLFMTAIDRGRVATEQEWGKEY
jgi:type I restriction enzyme S subunit